MTPEEKTVIALMAYLVVIAWAGLLAFVAGVP